MTASSTTSTGELDVQLGPHEVVGGRLKYWARVQPEKRFFKCGERWLSYREASDACDQVGAGLQSIGIDKGQQVATLMPNREEYALVFLALATIGAVHVPVNPFLRGEFLRYQLEDSEAQTLITDADGLALTADLLETLPNLTQVVLVGKASDDVSHVSLPVVPYAQLLEVGTDVVIPDLVASDLCAILYTSGTAGMPKGCMMSHGYYLLIGREQAAAGLMSHDDTLLSPYQLFHTSGQVYCLTSAMDAGASVALEAWFSASGLMRSAREVGATILYGPGAMGAALLKQPEDESDRDHNIRVLFGVPMMATLQDALEKRFGFRVCAETYGQTEVCTPSISSQSEPKRPGTAGKVTPYFDVRIVDDNDDDVPLGEVGEIVVRPKLQNGMFSGYWRKPAETLNAWRNLWHHTGDNGRLDADGYLTFVDRKKDSLRRRGENVSSLELEQALLMHPGVVGVAAHGVPSDLGEEEIKIVVVSVDGYEHTPEEFFDFMRKNLPYFALPRYLEFLDELPLSAMSRVQKFKLVERGVTPETWDFEQLGLVVDRNERRAK